MALKRKIHSKPIMDIPPNKGAKTKVSTDLDFQADGKQVSYLKIPYSRNTSAWGRVLIPIVQFKNGAGPTTLLTGGVHGDEFEGPVVLIKLIERLKLEQVSGRIIILPAVNMPAHMTSTRLSPLDNIDMNRCFPGDAKGSVTQIIAHYINSILIPMADFVVDFHSGGKSLDFVPCAVMHRLTDKKLEKKTLRLLRRFGSPYGLYLNEGDPDGLLDSAVESRGKIFISTELRGGATVNASAVAIADNGVCNLLQEFGVARVKPSRYTKYRSQQTQILLHTDNESCFVASDEDGLFEPLIDLGGKVKEGQPIAQLHHTTTPGRKPKLLKSAHDGVVICRRVPGRAEAGDCLLVIGIEKSWECS